MNHLKQTRDISVSTKTMKLKIRRRIKVNSKIPNNQGINSSVHRGNH